MNAWTRIGLPSVVFADRADAGNRLAPLVVGDVGHDGHRGIVVAGLVRGGLPVAAPIARALGAPLDVLCVGKIGVPSQRELAMGAVGEGDVVVSNAHVRQAAGIDDATFAAAAARVAEDVRAQLAQYRDVAPAVPLEGRTVVVVDDGVATGSTALAALRVVRAKGARRVLLAVPVAPSVELRELGEEADEVICLESPAAMAAVGQFYADFSQVTDDDVRRLLRSVSSSAQPADVHIEAGGALLDGILTVPRAARG
ncbi:MAG: phosphoribosyltransferase family protein, partial [Actinomycetota bacterium]|nr:phosphoribosyltransferase family protein [Actinomycetota bacterium]